MSLVSLSHPTKIIKGSIKLPASKSISNRALILQPIKTGLELHHLSTADDTVLMQHALQQKSGEVNVKNAGTCMRFLTAYFAAQTDMDIILTGDPRMEKRPIHMLVDALRTIGAEISYLKQDGFPPLHIKGKKLSGGSVKIDAGTSSQFISALMMIAPLCEQLLTIELTGTISSQPYIDMTAKMMQQLGFDITVNYPFITIHPVSHNQIATLSHYTIEPDWSAASYWYEIAALSVEAEILLEGLSLESLQGDKVVAELMRGVGVETLHHEKGILIRRGKISRGGFLNYKDTKGNGDQSEILLNHKGTEDTKGNDNQSEIRNPKSEIHLIDAPDLAPTLAVVAAALGIGVTLTGLQNLMIKESNRLQAVGDELRKCGFSVKETSSSLAITPSTIRNFALPMAIGTEIRIQTYGDHRMAMAFAPLALVAGDITIEHPEVVEKSYPHFWDDLHKVGFNLKS